MIEIQYIRNVPSNNTAGFLLNLPLVCPSLLTKKGPDAKESKSHSHQYPIPFYKLHPINEPLFAMQPGRVERRQPSGLRMQGEDSGDRIWSGVGACPMGPGDDWDVLDWALGWVRQNKL